MPCSSQCFPNSAPGWTMHTVSRSFAISSFKSSVNSLVKKDRMEVCPLSRGIMLQSLSAPITGAAFAFSIAPYPHPPSASLTVGFPTRRLERIWAYHVPYKSTVRVRFLLSAGSFVCPCVPKLGGGQPTASPVWFRLISNFSLFAFNDVYQ